VGDQATDVVELVAAARQGDERAWGEIVDRYSPMLIGVLQRYRLTPAELQDVAQTVWLRLIENLDRLIQPRALPGWIITTARREALRSLAVGRRADPSDPQSDLWTSRLAIDDDPSEAVELEERRVALLAGFASLTDRQRCVLLLLCQDPPLSYREVSERTGLPLGAIGPTRARALERLRHAPSIMALMAGADVEPNRGEGDE
jgi:RNA polymerase sigma factor (sigma-70 family)